jgi:hypothetical protein
MCKIQELREESRDNSANQLIIARLMDTLSHLSHTSSSSFAKYLRVFDCYTVTLTLTHDDPHTRPYSHVCNDSTYTRL